MQGWKSMRAIVMQGCMSSAAIGFMCAAIYSHWSRKWVLLGYALLRPLSEVCTRPQPLERGIRQNKQDPMCVHSHRLDVLG
eukprot:9024761-Pyramimonas_sp.AAC.1